MFANQTMSEPAEEREVKAKKAKAGTGVMSYLQADHWLRTIVGILGILLPVGLVVGEWKLLNATEWEARGSLSEYYHSGVRDAFVGVLVIVGLVLIT